jgi:hypothetical protein
MKSLKNYIAESTGVYPYVIKMPMAPSDAQVNTVESLLRAYQLVDISKPIKIVDDKFDFFDIPLKDVHCIHITLGTPISSYVLMQQLRNALVIPEKNIVVRTITEPVEINAQEQMFKNEEDAKAKSKGFTFASNLSTDRLYDPVEGPAVTNVFGDDYNKNLLLHLAHMKSERKSDEVDAPSSLFTWLDKHKAVELEPKQDVSDFNAHLDTPKPVTGTGDKSGPIDINVLGKEGNFNDAASNNYRIYVDKAGKRSSVKTSKVGKK